MTFADAILKLRSERRLSQTQFAKELGVSYTSVNRWENGRSFPTKMMRLVIRRYCEKHHLEFSYEEVDRLSQENCQSSTGIGKLSAADNRIHI